MDYRKTKCTAQTKSGRPCRAWAMHNTEPPLCAVHGGATLPPGAPQGNSNARTHGFYADTNIPNAPLSLPAIIHNLAEKQQEISDYLDDCLAPESKQERPKLTELVSVFELHARNASRLGRLLRDERALSGEASDGIAGAIAQALDELSTILGTPL